MKMQEDLFFKVWGYRIIAATHDRAGQLRSMPTRPHPCGSSYLGAHVAGFARRREPRPTIRKTYDHTCLDRSYSSTERESVQLPPGERGTARTGPGPLRMLKKISELTMGEDQIGLRARSLPHHPNA